MSFRQFGGLKYLSKHNVVSSNLNSSNQLFVTQSVGQPNSTIDFLSDISGNITVYGNLDISGNSHVEGNLDISGNSTANYMFLSSGNVYASQSNAVMPKSYIDLVASGITVAGKVFVVSTVQINLNNPQPNLIVDSVSVPQGQYVLLVAQSNAVENGAYLYNNSNYLVRNTATAVLPLGSDAVGALVLVLNGLLNAKSGWLQSYKNSSTNEAIVGVDTLNFVEFYSLNFKTGNGLQTNVVNDVNIISVDPSLNYMYAIDGSNNVLNLGSQTTTTGFNIGSSSNKIPISLYGTTSFVSSLQGGGNTMVQFSDSSGGSRLYLCDEGSGSIIPASSTTTLYNNTDYGLSMGVYNLNGKGILKLYNNTTNYIQLNGSSNTNSSPNTVDIYGQERIILPSFSSNSNSNIFLTLSDLSNNSVNRLNFGLSMGPGGLNGITKAGDNIIYWDNNTSFTANATNGLCIGPHLSTISSGIRIDISGVSINTNSAYSNTHGYALDVSGNLNFSGTLTQNGSTIQGLTQWSNQQSNLNNIYYTTGNVGIGTSTPSSTLDVSGTITSNQTITGAAFNATSDYRIKENVVELDETYTIDNLRPVKYTNKLTGKEDLGLIAHELQEIYPFLVNGKKDDETQKQSINYQGLIAVLINEIKELKNILRKNNLY